MSWKTRIGSWFSLRWARRPLARTQAWESAMHEGMRAFQDGRTDAAEGAYAAALEEAERFAEGDPRLTVSLDSLIGLYRLHGKYVEAEPLCRRALAVKEKVYGPHHPNLASTFKDLSEVYRALGQDDRAADYHRRALAVLERAIGPDFEELSESLGKAKVLQDDEGR